MRTCINNYIHDFLWNITITSYWCKLNWVNHFNCFLFHRHVKQGWNKPTRNYVNTQFQHSLYQELNDSSIHRTNGSRNSTVNRVYYSGDLYWYYNPDALSLSQDTVTHLMIGHPQMKSTGARSSNQLHRLDYMTGYQDSSPSNGCWATCPIITYCKISNIRCTISRNLNDSRLMLQLYLPNPLKPGV